VSKNHLLRLSTCKLSKWNFTRKIVLSILLFGRWNCNKLWISTFYALYNAYLGINYPNLSFSKYQQESTQSERFHSGREVPIEMFEGPSEMYIWFVWEIEGSDTIRHCMCFWWLGGGWKHWSGIFIKYYTFNHPTQSLWSLYYWKCSRPPSAWNCFISLSFLLSHSQSHFFSQQDLYFFQFRITQIHHWYLVLPYDWRWCQSLWGTNAIDCLGELWNRYLPPQASYIL